MNDTYREQSTEPLYVGYVYLPTRRCRLRFVQDEQAVAQQDIPVWTFTVAMVAVAVLIGVCGALLLLPYGALCR